MGKKDNNLNEEKEIQEETEEQLTDKDKELLENKAENKLLGVLADEFVKYCEDNKQNISPEEMFLQFLKQKGSTDKQKILEVLERKMWRRLTFSDIKNLYLKSGYTIEKAIYKDIFKDFKRKDAVKSVVKKLEEKVNTLLTEGKFRTIDFSQYLPEKIKNDKDIDKLFDAIHYDFSELIKKLKTAIWNPQITPERRQELEHLIEKLKNTVVTNEELLNQMEQDKVINSNERKFLEGDSSVTSLTDKQKTELNSIFNTLFNWSLITTLSDFIDARRKVSLSLEKLKNLWTIQDVVGEYIENINTEEVNWLYDKIKDSLSPDELKEFDNCNDKKWASYNLCVDLVKKDLVVKKLNEDIELLAEFIKTKDPSLSFILDRIAKTGKIDDVNEKNKLFSYIVEKYIDDSLNFLASAFKFTEKEKEEYRDILRLLFDPSKPSFQIRNPFTGSVISIRVNKTIEFGDDIKKLSEEWPRFILEILGNDVDLFQLIFPEYFVDLNINGVEYKITKHSKVEITKKDGTVVSGYINKVGDEVEIYDEPFATTPKEVIKESDILSLSVVDKKLILENSDLKKLLLWLVSTLPWRNYEQSVYSLIDKKDTLITPDARTEEEIQEQLREFYREWKKFEWDDMLSKPEVGDILQVKWQALNIPGLINNWYYAEIVKMDREKGVMTLKIWWWILDFDWNTEYEVPMTWEFLKNLRYNANWNILKFKKQDNLKDFADYINNLELSSDFQGFKSTLWKWKNSDIKVENWKLLKKTTDGKYEPITHIWRQKVENINNNEIIEQAKYRSDLYDVWEVEYKKDKVVLKSPDTDFKKEMDLNTFMAVFLHNDLSPWTEKEYRAVKLDFETVVKWPEPKIWFAINDLILASKNIKDAFLYHFKQDDELRAAIMYENLTALMPGFWFLKDIKLEAGWEKESKLWRVIEDAKARLERAWEGKWENHGKKAAAIIKEEIFDLVLKWEELSTRHKLKAAWYLLYAMEKWPGPYFRKLAPYAGQWIWIRALLWRDHYYKWSNKVKELQDRLMQNPDDQQARNDLVLSEMFYIKDQDTTKIFSAKFGTTVEWLAIDVTGDMGRADKVYESEMKKWSFDLIYDWFKSYIWNDRPPNVMGALKAISERVEIQQHYIDYNKVITSLIFTGYLYHSWWNPYREEFDKICRTYSVPIGLFARETDWLNKVLRIFDYIVKKKGITPGGKKQSFTEYLYGKSSPDKVSVYELTNSTIRKGIIKKLESFWWEYGEEIVSSLDYTDTVLLGYLRDENIDKKEKKAIDEYFSKVNASSVWEDWEIAPKTFKSSYSPYYQTWVLNTSAAAFMKYALEVDEWDFEHNIGAWIWDWLLQKLDKLSDFMSKDEIYSFVLKKFISWFGRNYKSKDNAIMLIQALRSWDKEELTNAIYTHLKYSIWGHHGLIPPEMDAGLQKFVEVFSVRPSNIDDILNEEFKKSFVEQSYYYTVADIDLKKHQVNNDDYEKEHKKVA